MLKGSVLMYKMLLINNYLAEKANRTRFFLQKKWQRERFCDPYG